MESARYFVRRVFLLKLATRVELGEYDFDSGFAVDCGVIAVLDWIGGDASPVVGYFDRPVGLDGDGDKAREASHCFVDGVIDDFIDEVMERAQSGAADVHPGAFADSFKPFEDLDLVRGIFSIWS